MLNAHRVVALIPARGGSKGLPRKNVLPLAGKPLIAWSIAAAQASRYVDRTIVSTEDAEIARVAEQFGAERPFARPEELARDHTPSMDVVLHAIDSLQLHEDDVIVLLQPTSPLRTTGDIEGALEILTTPGAEATVSVTQPKHPPEWCFRASSAGFLKPLVEPMPTRRQDLDTVWALNGAVYAATVEVIKRRRSFVGSHTLPYPMPPERSFDIDSATDFLICNALLQAPHL